MRILGTTQFDQCVLNMALINICNQDSYVGQEMRKCYSTWLEETDEPTQSLWSRPYQFMIYVPHPDQQYEEMTLEAGLTRGYNIEVKPVQDRSSLPYRIPPGGHFVVVLKQTGLDAGFQLAATGIFIRSLAALSLDIIVDMQQSEYQPIVVQHPIIRDYPSDWQQKLKSFMQQEIRSEDLPDLVGYVDRAMNPDYRSPSWQEVSLAARGFAGV